MENMLSIGRGVVVPLAEALENWGKDSPGTGFAEMKTDYFVPGGMAIPDSYYRKSTNGFVAS